MPATLALGLAAASGRDAASAAFAFYLLGAGILAAMSVRKKATGLTDACYARIGACCCVWAGCGQRRLRFLLARRRNLGRDECPQESDRTDRCLLRSHWGLLLRLGGMRPAPPSLSTCSAPESWPR